MFSHIVIFWTKQGVEDAEKQLVDGLHQYLPGIPGVISMHVGRCAPMTGRWWIKVIRSP